MRLGETLDSAIRLYRRNWRTFMGVAAFILIPYFFIQEAVVASLSHPVAVRLGSITIQNRETSDAASLVAGLFALGSFVFVQPFLAGALARATAETYADRPVEVASTYRFALPLTWSILLVSLLTLLAALGGFLLLIVPGFLFYIRFMFGPPIVIVEGLKGRQAMRRSWRLAKGHFWRLFGTMLLAGILAGVIGGILGSVFILLGNSVSSGGWVLRAIWGSLSGVITRPFTSIVLVLRYFDLSVRNEGLDIAVMLQQIAPENR